MATQITTATTNASHVLTYQKAMHATNAIQIAKPTEDGLVMLRPQQLTRVETQAGKHYQLRQPDSNGKAQIPDDVIAVRHGDALHLRYADGSTASFENFFTVCTDESVCSVNLAGDTEAGFTLSGADGNGGVADDGMLVYAHGEQDTLMAMAQGQDSLLSALLSVADAPVITYLPPDVGLGTFALLALGIAGVASAAHSSGNGTGTGTANTGATTLTATEIAALNVISTAAESNTANSSGLAASVYAAAGVTGVTAANLAAINSALDSQPINGIAVDTKPEVQALVDAYAAILAEANGATPNTGPLLTATQFTAVGITGVSGPAVAGNALFLLDDMVNTSTVSAVDTVPELQAMADAAAHIIAAAGGTATQAAAVTVADLSALGITGVTTSNLAAIEAAIQATTPDTAIDTRLELQDLVNLTLSTIQTPNTLTSALLGVSNLDVRSNLVFSADQTVTVGSGMIHITDSGGAGYRGDTSTNTQTIDVSTAVANGLLTISGTGANTKIIINPQWDLDLASNYQITIDDGAFVSAGATALHLAPLSFSTVTPGTHAAGTAATEAVASQTMVDATGALTAGKSWLNIEGISNNTGSVIQLGDLSSGAFALVMKNYATVRGGSAALGGDTTDGIATHDANVGFTNFGNNDLVYFDSQVNNASTQFFDARYTSVTDGATVGGLAGQNTLVMGLVSAPQQQGSTAMILLGLEGNTSNQIYPGIVTLNATTVGWANDWHNTSAPVLMG